MKISALVFAAVFSAAASSFAAEPVVVEFWDKWKLQEGQAIAEVVKKFNETVGKDKNIRVEIKQVDYGDKKVIEVVNEGSPPDLVNVWQDQAASYAATKIAMPLEDIAAAKGIDKSTFKQVLWDSCNVDGHLVGLPISLSPIMLYWNKEIFAGAAESLKKAGWQEQMAAAGFDGTRAPRTLKEVSEFSKLISVRNADGKLLRAGFLPQEPGWWRATATPIWFGATLYDEKAGAFNFTSPEMLAAGEWLASFSKAERNERVIGEFKKTLGPFASAENAFMTGQVAMEVQGPWMRNFFADYKPEMIWSELAGMEKWPAAKRDEVMKVYFAKSVAERRRLASYGVAPMPSAASEAIAADPKLKESAREEKLLAMSAVYCDFDLLIVPRGAKHPKEAMEFAAFLCSREVMEKFCEAFSRPSPLRATSDAFVNGSANPHMGLFEQAGSSINARGMMKPAKRARAYDALSSAMAWVEQLQKTPEQAFKDAERDANKLAK